MSLTTYDIIVLGVGVMGAAACYALAKRGIKVLAIDQYEVGHAMGSSHGHTRMTRSAYFEHPDYVPLIKRANELWREIETESGADILTLCGAVYFGKPKSELIAGSKSAADLHGLEYNLLTRDDIAAEFPQFRLPSDFVGLWERNAGFIYAETALSALVEQSLKLGSTIQCEQAIDWQDSQDGVAVSTTKSTYHASKLILCAGPWSADVAANLKIELKVSRQVMGLIRPKKPELFTPNKIIPFAVDDHAGSLHYGFPVLPGASGMKVASHSLGVETTPGLIDRNPSPEDEKTFRAFLESVLPDAAGRLESMRVCMYTNSPDGHFIVSKLPEHSNVTIGCGFSGHGFKFAPVIGEALADLSLHGKSGLPIEFLSISRFHK